MARIYWETAACGRTSLGRFGCRIRTWEESVFGKPARTQLQKCNRQLVTSVVNGLTVFSWVYGRAPLPGAGLGSPAATATLPLLTRARNLDRREFICIFPQ